jgi:hypothetical protein
VKGPEVRRGEGRLRRHEPARADTDGPLHGCSIEAVHHDPVRPAVSSAARLLGDLVVP